MVATAYDWLFAPPGSRPPDWSLPVAAERVEDTIAGDRSTVLVAIAGEGDGQLRAGQIVGLATVYLTLVSVRYGPRAWVEDLAVHPDVRSQGVGKALLDASKAWAAEHGASHLELASSDGRRDAHRFYEREGPRKTTRVFNWVV